MHFCLRLPTLSQEKSINSFPHRPCTCSPIYVSTDCKVLDNRHHYPNKIETHQQAPRQVQSTFCSSPHQSIPRSAAACLLKQYFHLHKDFLASSRHLGLADIMLDWQREAPRRVDKIDIGRRKVGWEIAVRLPVLEQGQGEGAVFNRKMHGLEKTTGWLANGGNVGVMGI